MENLDKEYGANTFTKYLDAFKEQEVDIINFKDNDWITLGIEKVGPRSKIIRALINIINSYNVNIVIHVVIQYNFQNKF